MDDFSRPLVAKKKKSHNWIFLNSTSQERAPVGLARGPRIPIMDGSGNVPGWGPVYAVPFSRLLIFGVPHHCRSWRRMRTVPLGRHTMHCASSRQDGTWCEKTVNLPHTNPCDALQFPPPKTSVPINCRQHICQEQHFPSPPNRLQRAQHILQNYHRVLGPRLSLQKAAMPSRLWLSTPGHGVLRCSALTKALIWIRHWLLIHLFHHRQLEKKRQACAGTIDGGA